MDGLQPAGSGRSALGAKTGSSGGCGLPGGGRVRGRAVGSRVGRRTPWPWANAADSLRPHNGRSGPCAAELGAAGLLVPGWWFTTPPPPDGPVRRRRAVRKVARWSAVVFVLLVALLVSTEVVDDLALLGIPPWIYPWDMLAGPLAFACLIFAMSAIVAMGMHAAELARYLGASTLSREIITATRIDGIVAGVLLAIEIARLLGLQWWLQAGVQAVLIDCAMLCTVPVAGLVTLVTMFGFRARLGRVLGPRSWEAWRRGRET